MPRLIPLWTAPLVLLLAAAPVPKATGEPAVIAALLELLPAAEKAALGPAPRLEAVVEAVSKERRDVALAALTALEAPPAEPAALKAVLRARFLLGDAAGGLSSAEALRAASPGVESETLHAWALSWSGDYEAAYAAGLELAEKEPANRDIQALLAFNKGRVGRMAPAAAVPAMAEGIAVGGGAPRETSDQAMALMRRAVEARRAGDLDAVLALAREAMRADPKSPTVQELYRLVVADRARQEGRLRERLLAAQAHAEAPEKPAPPSRPELPPLWPVAAGAGASAALYGLNKGRKSWGDEGRTDPDPEVSPEQSRLNYLRSAVVIGAPLIIGAALTAGPYLAGAIGGGAASLQRVAASRAGFVATTAAEKVTHWGPMSAKGPLPESIAASFRSGVYTEKVLDEAVVLYRVYGGRAAALGPWWSPVPPRGELATRIDSALSPQWNSATQLVKIRVPPGTVIFEGIAAPQGGLVGGGQQIYILRRIDPAWVIQ
jgi:hypothetical protein